MRKESIPSTVSKLLLKVRLKQQLRMLVLGGFSAIVGKSHLLLLNFETRNEDSDLSGLLGILSLLVNQSALIQIAFSLDGLDRSELESPNARSTIIFLYSASTHVHVLFWVVLVPDCTAAVLAVDMHLNAKGIVAEKFVIIVDENSDGKLSIVDGFDEALDFLIVLLTVASVFVDVLLCFGAVDEDDDFDARKARDDRHLVLYCCRCMKSNDLYVLECEWNGRAS